MPRVEAKVQVNSFLGGLITEASDLNFPENGLKEALNVRIGKDGSIARRPGLKEHEDISNITVVVPNTGTASLKFKIYDWPEMRAKLFTIAGKIIYFKIINGSPYSSTLELSNETVEVHSLTTFEDSIVWIDTYTGGGINNEGVLRQITINKDAAGGFSSWGAIDPVSGTTLQVRIRDFTGVPNNLPSEGGELSKVLKDFDRSEKSDDVKFITESMYYNLLNAGWPGDSVDVARNPKGTGVVVEYPISSCLGHATTTIDTPYVIPALADSFEASRTSTAEETVAVNVFSHYELMKAKPLQAVRGSQVLEMFNMQLSRLGKLVVQPPLPAAIQPEAPTFLNLNIHRTLKHSTAVGSAFGRLWIGGFSISGLVSNIGFTQTLNNSYDNINRYYQENDPTAPEINQLLPTDGGVLSIQGAGIIHEMVEFRDKLIIFAEHGVWSVGGIEGSSFSADAYVVTKVSNTKCIGTGYSVVAEDKLFYLNKSNMSVISLSDFGLLASQDVSSGSIRTKMNNMLLNSHNLEGCSLSYDSLNATVHLNFKDYYREIDGVQNSYFDQRWCLLYDTLTGQWSEKFRGIKEEGTLHVGNNIVIQGEGNTGPGFPEVLYMGAMFDSESTINNPLGDNMLYTAIITEPLEPNVIAIQFYSESSDSFSDAYDVGPFETRFSTGPLILGDTSSTKQVAHLEIFSKNPKVIDKDSCTVTSVFDWSNVVTSPPFEAIQYQQYPVQVHHSDNDVLVTKQRLLGSGRSLQLTFENSSLDKGFHILGYSYTYSQPERP